MRQKRAWITAAALGIMLLFWRLPAPAGMTRAAMQVIGIFAGTLLLWLTVSIDWPSLLCMAALALVPELGMNSVLAAGFGNSTFAFLLFTFLCTYALSRTPFVRRCAVWFVSSRAARRGPWALAVLFFCSVLLLGAVISPTVLFVIYLPILEEIYAVLGIEKGEKSASMLMMGLVFCCGISSGMTPIAHVFPLMAMEFYHTSTGFAIDYAGYMAFAVPVGLLTAAAMLLLFRLVLRPDMSRIDPAGAAALRQTLEPMSRREKTVLAVFLGVVALWVVPSMIEPLAPDFYAWINGLGTAFPPLLGAVALSMLTEDGRSLLPFGEAMAKGVPWGSLIMCAGTLSVGAAMTNAGVGLTGWISAAIAPLAADLAPVLVVLLFAFWAAVQTNLSSNMVTVSVVTAIAVPVCLAYQGSVNTAAVCAIIGMLASYAFATPPAMPCVAIAGSSGWTSAGALLRYGFGLMLAAVALSVGVGYPIACLFL